MKVRHLKASSVVVEDDGTSVLCDPWLLDGAYYGSWAHYPQVDVEPGSLDVDYIYVSHIHPDHCHEATLRRLDTDIPVLVHDYEWDFLRYKLEGLGFDVRELPHDERVHLGGDLHLNVLASDDCDPEVCGSYFGCSWWMESAAGGGTDGSTQLDSMGVFDDGDHVVVNANDCRWPMTRQAASRVRESYGDIDFLMMQYGAANFYPQCMADYTHEELVQARNEVALEMLDDAASFVKAFEPDYYMPFAGSYTLAGSLADRNQYVAVAERHEARSHFESRDDIDHDRSTCVLLNGGEEFDLDAGTASAPYEPVDRAERLRYAREVLADREFTFESDPVPSVDAFEELVPAAYEGFEEKRAELGYESDTTVLLALPEDTFAAVSMRGDGYEFISRREADRVEGYVKMTIDPRLLERILKGPRYAHFNNAQIGSHIAIEKEPDIYERPLYYSMSFFHA